MIMQQELKKEKEEGKTGLSLNIDNLKTIDIEKHIREKE